MKETIKLDIDGVLRDCVTPLLDIYNKKFKENVKYENIAGWDIGEYLTKDPNYAKYFTEYPNEIFRDGPLYNPDTSEILNKINEKYDIHIVTHQFKGLEAHTIQWLHKHKIPYDAITFTKNKKIILGKYLIDDATHNIRDNNGYEIPVVFDQPWNKGMRGYKRISSLEELATLLDGGK